VEGRGNDAFKGGPEGIPSPERDFSLEELYE
jgi:hypothetical protein